MFDNSQEIIKKFTNAGNGKKSDYLLRENANFIYGLPLMRHNMTNRSEEKFIMDSIFSQELKKLYKDGDVYIHDKKLAPYCVSVSCKEIALSGVPTIAQNMLSSKATKKFTTFCRHLSNVVVLISQQVSGAVMLAQMTTVLASYAYNEEIKKGYFDKEHAYEAIKNLIWELNMPLRTGSQSAFSNITLEFGSASPEIEKDAVIIGGEIQDYNYNQIPAKFFDMITEMIVKIMSNGSGDGVPLTFPLITVPIHDDFKWDSNQFHYLLEKMYDWGGVYFENFQTKPFTDSPYAENNPMIKPRDPEVTRSMCPLDSTETILYLNKKSRVFQISNIKSIYDSRKKSGNFIVEVLQNGKIIKTKINKIKNKKNYIKIELVNGLILKTTEDHFNLTLRGLEIKSSDLTVNDYIPVAGKSFKGSGLSFNHGYIIGAFLGDGSYTDGNGSRFSLSEKKQNVYNQLKEYSSELFGAIEINDSKHISPISGKQSCTTYSFISSSMKSFIEEFVIGNNALEKNINMKSISMSKEFRRGIIQGIYDTDGGNNYRIYTSSKHLANSLISLYSSLGIATNISIDERDSKETLSDNPIYCIREYKCNNNSRKDIFQKKDDMIFFKIKSITPYTKHSDSSAYCLEVLENDEPYFQMPNGIITHNCRLSIDLKALSKVGGGIFGSSTANTGAVQVINVNLNRLFLRQKLATFENDEDFNFYDALGDILEIVQEGHQAKRKWIENNKNLYPTFFAYNKDLKNYFNVFSICGMHEGLINVEFEDGIEDEQGEKTANSILKFIHDKLNEFIERDHVACGLEFAPGENAAVKMARDDLKFAKRNKITCFTQGEGDDVFLTSGAMLPFSSELPNLIENASKFQSYATSGSILHHFISDRLNPDVLSKYIQKLFMKPIIYTTITPTITNCNKCKHKMVKTPDDFKCTKCTSDDISIYSRAIGYVKPVARKSIKMNNEKINGDFNFWSSARRYDFTERKQFDEGNLSKINLRC